jgi:hypothetical protein
VHLGEQYTWFRTITGISSFAVDARARIHGSCVSQRTQLRPRNMVTCSHGDCCRCGAMPIHHSEDASFQNDQSSCRILDTHTHFKRPGVRTRQRG